MENHTLDFISGEDDELDVVKVSRMTGQFFAQN